MAKMPTKYFVFDVESVADGRLVSQVRYPAEGMEAGDAVQRYREELLAERGVDFIPYTFQIPISIVVAKVGADFRLQDVALLDEPEFRSHVMTELFWRGWEAYEQPTLVTFNGRTFDIPVLELAAFRYGLSIPAWFSEKSRAYEQPRNRFNTSAHLDVQEILVNYGATRFHGGLNLAATMLGKPGKMDVQGCMVQDMYDAGQLAEINDYCRCDVLDTYFVFLRTCVLMGRLTLQDEQAVIRDAKQWIEQRRDGSRAYQQYLEQWGDWANPWQKDGSG